MLELLTMTAFDADLGGGRGCSSHRQASGEAPLASKALSSREGLPTGAIAVWPSTRSKRIIGDDFTWPSRTPSAAPAGRRRSDPKSRPTPNAALAGKRKNV